MVSADTFKHLSTELFNRFGYTNKFAKVVTDVQNLMDEVKEGKGISEFALNVPYDQLSEARERLTCKI